MAPANCSNCGADVPRNARCCPACGADEQTGWSDEAPVSPLDVPEESCDYDDYVKREFGGPDPRPRGIAWLWWVTAILLLAVGLVWLLGR